MKHSTLKSLYWIITGLTAAFMLMASIPDILRLAQAVAIFTHLGYPSYLLPFLGTAKVLGVIVVLIPGLGRLKEWAYAGLVFDLLGAWYSHLSLGDPASVWLFPVIGLILVTASYSVHRRMLDQAGKPFGNTVARGQHPMSATGIATRLRPARYL